MAKQLGRPLRLHHDSAVGPLYEPYIKDFNAKYTPLQVETSYVTGDYPALTQTQLAGGSVDYDVLFADDGYALKWFNAGWIRSLDDIDGVKDVLARLDPGIEANCRTPEGKLITLPYYRGVEIFIYNKEHLDKIGAAVPKTWDEFMTVCRDLKGKKVVDTPYSPFWCLQFTVIWTQLLAESYSDGSGEFFANDLKPLFHQDPVVYATLQRWNTLYKEKLIPQDVFTTDYGNIANIFAGAKSSFTIRYGPQLVQFTDPAQSKSATGAKNAPMPGKTGATHAGGAWWMMTSSTPQPQTAWELMRYFAWADRSDVPFFQKKLLAIDLGLQTAFSSINNDPEVRAAWAKWCDAEGLAAQIKNSRSDGPVVLAEWYGEFQTKASELLQEAVRGTKPIQQALDEAAAFVTSKM